VAVSEELDIVYLGGGTGGYVSAVRASQLGLRTAIVEKYKVGGTCLHWGCIPSKTLLQSAKVLDTVRHGGDYGVLASDVSLDYAKVQARKEQVVNQLYRGVQYLLKKANASIIEGEGSLSSPTSVVVKTPDGERTVRAKNVIVDTGSRPRPLPGVPFDGQTIISSDYAVNLQAIPSSVVIIGAGAVGVEFATFFNTVGAKVTLIELLPSIVPLEDADVGSELERTFVKAGMTVYSGAKSTQIEESGAGARVSLETREGQRVQVDAEKVLVAIGRDPNSDGIGLEAAGVKTTRGLVDVDGHYQTSVPHVYAIGDVIGHFRLAHEAMHEGIIAAEAIAGHQPEPLDYDRVPRCTYSQPQVASIGISEQEARGRGRPVKVGKFPLSANSKARIEGYPDGFAKVIGNQETGEILGVYLIGASVTELIDSQILVSDLATPVTGPEAINDLIDQLRGEDYVTTARAKGASPWRVLLRHALRNSMFGLLTVAGLQVGVLLGTTVVVEQIFSVPGVGQQLLSAIQNEDVPVVEGIVTVIATITVLANLTADVLYAVLNPRVRLGAA